MNRTYMLAALTCVSLSLSTGCKKSAAPATQPTTSYTQAAVAAGGTLNSDGSVTNLNGTITEPNGTVVPAPQNGQQNVQSNTQQATSQTTQQPAAGSAPVAQQQAASTAPPAPASAPAPVTLTAPRGTSFTVRTNEEISASRDTDGSRWTGTLERPVVYHGATIFERGTPVSGEVVAAKKKGEFKGAGDLSIVVTDIGHSRVHSSEYTLVNKGRGKRTGAIIGGGGGLGAIIGGIAGGGKGALIGGLAGAGAGTAVSTTGSKDVVIRPESVITFRLTEPATR